ncbi:hypothetical protein QTN25_001238 [Entamoeba marina]
MQVDPLKMSWIVDESIEGIEVITKQSTIEVIMRIEEQCFTETSWIGLYDYYNNSNNNYITWKYVNNQNVVSFTNLTPGLYQVKYFTSYPHTECQYETQPITLGEKVGVLVCESFKEDGDWVGIFPVTQNQCSNNNYISYAYVQDSNNAVIQLPQSLKGLCTVRYFRKNSYKRRYIFKQYLCSGESKTFEID